MAKWSFLNALFLFGAVLLLLQSQTILAHRKDGANGFCGCLELKRFHHSQPAPNDPEPQLPPCYDPPPCEPETETLTETMTQYTTITSTLEVVSTVTGASSSFDLSRRVLGPASAGTSCATPRSISLFLTHR